MKSKETSGLQVCVTIPIDIIRDFNHGWISVESSRSVAHVFSLYWHQNTRRTIDATSRLSASPNHNFGNDARKQENVNEIEFAKGI